MKIRNYSCIPKLLFLTVSLFTAHFGMSQSISGYVLDSLDNKPIPFVNIIIDGTNHGTSSDIDGFFEILPSGYPMKIKLHSLGYTDTTITFSFPQTTTIKLLEKSITLGEAVVVAGENPAIPIIKKAIENRKINDPEKNYPFTYSTYSKMVFGPEIGHSQANIILSDTSSAFDSASYAFREAMKKHYFFITETVTERKFIPPSTSFENVTANRVSGLENPAFTMIATEFQPFSYYSDYVDIIGLKYLSPLARNSYNNYVFELKDAFRENNDTMYVIHFQPKKGSSFNGLKGSLTINSHFYAIQNIQVTQANPTSTMQVTVEQMSQFIDNKQWFPIQFNTHIVFKMDNTSSSAMAFDFIDAKGKTYIRNIKVGVEFSKKEFPNVDLQLDSEANKQTSDFWTNQRKEPLSNKEENTYTVVDSIGKELKLDQKMKLAEAVVTGFVPIGPVSIELNKLIDYNLYQGLRLGLGVRTNDKISKVVSVGGYAAYGFNDVHWKYGGDLKFVISRKNDISAGVKYLNDLTPTAAVDYFKKETFNLRSYSNLYINKMDKIEGFEVYATFRALRDFQNQLFFNSYSQSYNYNYTYAPKNDTVLTSNNAFKRVEVGWSFRFGLKEKYMRNFNQNISLGTKYPYLWVRFAAGNEVFGSDFNYEKIDARVSKKFLIKGLGKLGFQVQGGTTTGEVPLNMFHFGNGMRISGFNLYIENAFNTMAPNEFVSQTYLSGFLHLNIGAIYKTQYSAPEISLVTAAGWGTLDHKSDHRGMEFSTMEKGYYESGLLLDNIIILNTSGIGVGAFYRYGPYAFPNVADNFGFSFTFMYVLQ